MGAFPAVAAARAPAAETYFHSVAELAYAGTLTDRALVECLPAWNGALFDNVHLDGNLLRSAADSTLPRTVTLIARPFVCCCSLSVASLAFTVNANLAFARFRAFGNEL